MPGEPARLISLFGTAVMTLGNMRENGIRSLAITCGALWCNHEAVLDVSACGDDAPYRSGPSKSWIKVKNPKAPAPTRTVDGTF